VSSRHDVFPGKQCRPGRQGNIQPSKPLHSLLGVNAADLALPALMVAEPEAPAATPEVVRLVALARTGDRAAFGRLIEDHLTAARRLALAAVGQPSDADEAVQEASVAAWTRLHALNDPAAFRGWFMRIVWRKAIDRRRSLRSWLDRFGSASDDEHPIECAASDPSPDAQLISRELALAIARVVKALPRKLRDPFLLAASGDHRYEEIAALLGIPIGTVKWRISEARRMIRIKLDRLGHGDPR
jgi:RNA polymerase sigma-70 factor (ECF subfamily)